MKILVLILPFFVSVWAMQEQRLPGLKDGQGLMVLVKENQKLSERVAHLEKKKRVAKKELQKDEDDRFYFSDAQRYRLMKKYVEEEYVCLRCVEDEQWAMECQLLLDECEVKELTIQFLKGSITEQNINFLLLKKELRSIKQELETVKKVNEVLRNRNSVLEVVLFCSLMVGMYYYQFCFG